MEANILGWGKNGYSRSIIDGTYRKYQIEIGSNHYRSYDDRNYIVNTDDKYEYIDLCLEYVWSHNIQYN